jgi:predicted methyltransferase
LYAAHFPKDSGVPYYDQSLEKFTAKLAADPSVYGKVILSTFDPANAVLTVPEGVADRVLTFRNVHNWLRSDSEGKAFELFFRALKPGGVLGVVEHRASRTIDRAEMIRSGYMPEAYVIELAEKAGFVLAAKSEVNANPRDTTDHPEGVWTLPPTLRLQERDREKYQAIGESDRMTLKFIKPAAP